MKKVEIIQLVVGSLSTNCYLLVNDKKEVIIVDPGDDAEYIIDVIEQKQLKPLKLIATHGHFDHVLATFQLQETYKIPFFIHKKDEFLLNRAYQTARHFSQDIVGFQGKVDEHLKEGIKIGFDFTVIETPGHTPGSVSLYQNTENIILVGDLIFAGGLVGDTSFSYGNSSHLRKSISKVLSLPNETMIMPGHGQMTTVNNEKILNMDSMFLA